MRLTCLAPLPWRTVGKLRPQMPLISRTSTSIGRTSGSPVPPDNTAIAGRSPANRSGQEVISARFATATCQRCSSRAQCTHGRYRGLTFRPRERYLALQDARERQGTEAFKETYASRAGIEGTLSQAVRVSDLRQARYCGLPKTHLQHVITATAINVRRMVSWLIEPSLHPTQVSRFAALALQHSKPAA